MLDTRTARCLRSALNLAGLKSSCNVPRCAAGTAAFLPQLIEQAAEAPYALLFCDAGYPKPVSGINVVARDHQTGAPLVARLSGAAGIPGSFQLPALTAGSYDVDFLDGATFDGAFVGLTPSHIQRNNLDYFRLGPRSVEPGNTVDVSLVEIAIDPLSVDHIAVGADRFADSGIDPQGGILPAGAAGQPYNTWLHLRGGVRPITLDSALGLPGDLQAIMVTPGAISIEDQGEHWVEIQGTPSAQGVFGAVLTLRDDHNTRAALPWSLTITQ